MSHGTCHYCYRRLAHPKSGLRWSATKDHIHPRCLGGTVTVPCCLHCNHLKADMTADKWWWVMNTFPNWWRDFRSRRDLLRSIEAHRAEKIRASAERRHLMKHGPKWPDSVKVPVAPICRGMVG